MISWNFFPQSRACPAHLLSVIDVFDQVHKSIDSSTNSEQHSNDVLAVVRPGLEQLGYVVEAGKKKAEKIPVPVLFGVNGRVEKSFDADAWSKADRTVIEVEAGRAVVNNQFLKDLFQACMMHEVDFLVIAVRITYGKGNQDFQSVSKFMDTLYTSGRLQLPLHGVLVLGY
jgi:hypothetical protein